MKIINLTTSNTGGAGNAVLRICNTLNFFSDSKVIALKGKNNNDTIIIPNSDLYFFTIKVVRYLRHYYFQKFSNRFNNKYNFYNYCEKKNYVKPKKLIKYFPFKPDIIIIHYTSHFINFKTIYELQKSIGCEVIFNMLDTAFLTGGCHYSWSCKGYMSSCKNCAAIKNKSSSNIAHKNLINKLKYLNKIKYRINASSNWAISQITKSKLFDFNNSNLIYYPIDQNLFKPHNYKTINSIDLSGHKVVLIGSQDFKDERKGSKYLYKLFELLTNKLSNEQSKKIVFLIVGNNKSFSPPFQNINLGGLSMEELIYTYSLADVFLCPSVEDNGPMMINEALMCGTPVVSFNTGISADLVNNKTGYLANNFNAEDLTNGLIEVLFKKNLNKMSLNCRSFALQKYSNEKIKNNWEQFIYQYDTIQ